MGKFSLDVTGRRVMIRNDRLAFSLIVLF